MVRGVASLFAFFVLLATSARAEQAPSAPAPPPMRGPLLPPGGLQEGADLGVPTATYHGPSTFWSSDAVSAFFRATAEGEIGRARALQGAACDSWRKAPPWVTGNVTLYGVELNLDQLCDVRR